MDSGSKSYPGQRGVVHGRGWGVGGRDTSSSHRDPRVLAKLDFRKYTSSAGKTLHFKSMALPRKYFQACAYSRHYSHADGVPASRSFTEFVFERHKSFALLGLG